RAARPRRSSRRRRPGWDARARPPSAPRAGSGRRSRDRWRSCPRAPSPPPAGRAPRRARARPRPCRRARACARAGSAPSAAPRWQSWRPRDSSTRLRRDLSRVQCLRLGGGARKVADSFATAGSPLGTVTVTIAFTFSCFALRSFFRPAFETLPLIGAVLPAAREDELVPRTFTWIWTRQAPPPSAGQVALAPL